ncbi:hypothetical protein ACF8FB_03150 [Pseudomonas sp. yb_2]|uniref:hypothetical protein n=1 Tax=Pseudomonas sp. yb_2 TaxID=3367218 RepID=UPI003709D99A
MSSGDEYSEKGKGLQVGDMSVVMGKIPPGTRVGYGSVVLGATDERGNCIYNTPMTVGYGAKGNSTSVVIGAFAGSASGVDESIHSALDEILELLRQNNFGGAEPHVEALREAVNRGDKGLVEKSLGVLSGLANAVTVAEAVPKVSAALFTIKGYLASAGLISE